jgi:hypothetical protein
VTQHHILLLFSFFCLRHIPLLIDISFPSLFLPLLAEATCLTADAFNTLTKSRRLFGQPTAPANTAKFTAVKAIPPTSAQFFHPTKLKEHCPVGKFLADKLEEGGYQSPFGSNRRPWQHRGGRGGRGGGGGGRGYYGGGQQQQSYYPQQQPSYQQPSYQPQQPQYQVPPAVPPLLSQPFSASPLMGLYPAQFPEQQQQQPYQQQGGGGGGRRGRGRGRGAK